MPLHEVEPFLEENHFQQLSREERYVTNDMPWQNEWWNPDSATQFICGERSNVPQTGGGCWVLIDLDHPSVAVLYLFWQGP
jgi:hypothetical protein